MDKIKKGISEKDHFNSIASKYVKKDVYPPSRIARRHRVKQTVANIAIQKTPNVLEVGCGAGYASEYLKGCYSEYTGIDFSGELIDIAKSIHKGPKIHFHEADLYKFKSEKKYDLIVIVGVLHHMEDIPAALKICRKLLKPDGKIAVNEPQDANIIVKWVRWLRSKYDSTYSSDQEALKRKELVKLFNDSGYKQVSVSAQGFFSTPFAEVMLKPGFIFLPLSYLFRFVDLYVEKFFGRILTSLSWNIIVTGESHPD